MYEAIAGDNKAVKLVLLVKAQAGSGEELVDHRALVGDKVFIAATMNISYMLIACESSEILTAGTESATVQGHGSIKDVLEFDARTVRHLPLETASR